MKAIIIIPVNSNKPDLGVTDAIEVHRDLYETTGMRSQIADKMTQLLGGRARITRQMIEKWFNRERRITPSSVLLVALLTACAILKEQNKQPRQRQKLNIQ